MTRAATAIPFLVLSSAVWAPSALADEGASARVWLMPELSYQRIEGFGQGSMDQANVPWLDRLPPEARERLLDRLYTVDDDGLGLRICRTYIAGGDHPSHGHMSRRPGGSPNPRGYEAGRGRYTWQGHQASLWHAQGAAKRGAVMVAFWNSPPHWMTVSACSAGSADGKGNNLQPGMEERFAEHMCAVLTHFRDAWGISFDYVSPVNEPEADWWGEGGGQEGCHVDGEQAAAVIAALDAALRRHGLRTRIQAFEAAFSGSVGYLDYLLGSVRAGPAVTVLTCHQYQVDDSSLRRWARRSVQNERPLWMSEWGDWRRRGSRPSVALAQALGYARNIHQALRVMRANAWAMWEPAFIFDERDGTLRPRKAYWAIAHHSRFIRPGMRLIEAVDTTLQSTACVDEPNRSFTVITINDRDEAVNVDYDVSRFTGCRVVEVRRTSLSEDFERVPYKQKGSLVTVRMPGQAVVTVAARYREWHAGKVVNAGFESGDANGWLVAAPGDSAAAAEDNYPNGGLYDGFVHPTRSAAAEMWQTVGGLEPGATYRLGAACATSGIPARLGVRTGAETVVTEATGGAYRQYEMLFTAAGDGRARLFYRAGTAGGEQPWATIDNVFLAPAGE